MNKFLLLSFSIIVYKLVINFSRYRQVKQEFERYKEYLKDSKWEFTQHTPKIIKLFQDANVKDNVVHAVEPVGYGQLLTGNVSVFNNIANRREDVVESVYSKFHQSIGIYRSRMWDAINPLYWVEFILMLPKQLLSYLGVKPESVGIKVAQLIYWFVGLVLGLLGSAYKNEIDIAIRQFISQIVK